MNLVADEGVGRLVADRLGQDGHDVLYVALLCGVSGGQAMKHSYLEVTYRKGRPMAAYFHLPRQDGDQSFRTERVNGGLLIDYSSDGRAIGIEITVPSRVDQSALNEILVRLGHDPVDREDMAPLVAA